MRMKLRDKKNKVVIIAFTLLVGVLGFGESARAASLLSKVDFEQELNDPYDFMWFENPGTVTGYVPGHTGYAVRSSHSFDDNVHDNPNGYGLVITTTGGNGNNYWPDSNELYISYWIKYEEDYYNPSNNVKWLWTYGNGEEDYHNELIFASQTATTISGRWFLQGNNMQAWSNGHAARYWTANYVMGNWMHVEIYYKLSTGVNHDNNDGTQWMKINGTTVISDNQVVTGKPNRMSVPSINALSSGYTGIEAGHGWFQLDDYEIWDGIPNQTTPNRSNPQPTGTLASGTTSTNISLTTDKQAICRYTNVSGTNYSDMEVNFTYTNSTNHSTLVSGLENGQTYTFYVRCNSSDGFVNDEDFIISFSVDGHKADINDDGVINMPELMAFIARWKAGDGVSKAEVLDARDIWFSEGNYQ